MGELVVPGDEQRDRVGRPLPPRQPRPADTGDRGCLACTHMDGGVYCSNDSTCPRPAAPVVRAEDAADGLRERLIEEIAGWPLGSGYYQYTVSSDDAREIADHLLREVRALRELAAAEKVRRMEAEHRPEQIEDVGPEGPVAIAICVADHDYWPCDVRRALDGEEHP